MPVKGQSTKSRTAKSTKKGPKLKWWYILPVIAIVAVAGYAIVRYSQASSEAYVKTVDNGGITSGNPFYKYYKQGYGNLAVSAPKAAVGAFFGREASSYKYTCAVVRGNFVDDPGGASVVQIILKSNNYSSSSTRPIKIDSGFSTICYKKFSPGDNPNNVMSFGISANNYNANVISLSGKVFVYRMFLTNTLPQGAKI